MAENENENRADGVIEIGEPIVCAGPTAPPRDAPAIYVRNDHDRLEVSIDACGAPLVEAVKADGARVRETVERMLSDIEAEGQLKHDLCVLRHADQAIMNPDGWPILPELPPVTRAEPALVAIMLARHAPVR